MTEWNTLGKIIYEAMGFDRMGDWEAAPPDTREFYRRVAANAHGLIAKSCCCASCGQSACLTTASPPSSAEARSDAS